jgi:hypothetical protein
LTIKPPDPRDREAFDLYVDLNPGYRLSLDEIEAEGFHWIQWLADHKLIATAPFPGKVLHVAGWVCGIFGASLSILGLAGHLRPAIGDVATQGGAAVVVISYFITRISASAVSTQDDAIALVGLRLEVLRAQADAIAEGRRGLSGAHHILLGQF